MIKQGYDYERALWQKGKNMSKREFLETLSIELNKQLTHCIPSVLFNEELNTHVLKVEYEDATPIVIEIDALYQAHQNGVSVVEISDTICKAFNATYFSNMETVMNEMSQYFDSAAPYLYASLSKYDEEKLRNKPYFCFMDLAVSYYVEVELSNGTICKAHITDGIFENWKIDADTLHNVAVTNTFSKKNPTITPLVNAIMGGAQFATNHPLYDLNMMLVITNESTMFGAINMFNVEILDNASFLLSSDEIYIIPSSIHEILVCAKNDMDAGQLKSTLKEVNDSLVREDEVLSNNLYLFNRQTKKISIV